MKLPKQIEDEIGGGRQVGEYVDQWGLPVSSETISAFARRIARMVAEDCAALHEQELADWHGARKSEAPDEYNDGGIAGIDLYQVALRARYGLKDEQDED